YQVVRMQQVRELADDVRERSVWTMTVVALIGVVVAIAFATLVTGRISRPVRALAEAARRMTQGDLTVEELAITSRDEVGEMSLAFNSMVQNLRQLVTDVI